MAPSTMERPRRGRGRSAAGRRARFATLAAVLIAACTASLVLVNVLATRYAVRMDVTATGEHRLSPRAARTLESLTGEYRIVIAAELAGIDARARQDTADVLERLERASPQLKTAVIDTAAESGQERFHALVTELNEREREAITAQSEAIERQATGLEPLAEALDALAPGVERVRAAMPEEQQWLALRQALSERGALARTLGRELPAAGAAAREMLGAEIAGVRVARTDRAAGRLIQALQPIAANVGVIAKELEQLAGLAALPEAARDAAKAAAARAGEVRDASATAVDRLQRLPRLDVVRVAEALQQTGACVVIGPAGKGVTAIALEEIYPAAPTLDAGAARADSRRRVEELLTTALATLQEARRPVVVITHAEARSFMDRVPVLSEAVNRLSRRGIDVVEWAIMVEAEPSGLARVDPKNERPRVYVTLAPDSGAAAGAAGEATGAERAQRLGAVLTRLADDGANLLLSLNPSVFPTFGDRDPTAAVLTRFGLTARSGMPILSERLTARGRLVETEQSLLAERGDDALRGAVGGLPVVVSWAVALEPGEPPAAAATAVTPLLMLRGEAERWQESQWVGWWRVPRAQRGITLDAPAFDEGKDARAPGAGWMIGAAAEVRKPGLPPQRLVAVGSNGWFFDAIAGGRTTIDGRSVLMNPGNLELLESAVLWLAFQDDLIAQSPDAQSIALVGPIGGRGLWWLRLGLIAGLPALVLLAGVGYRVLRG